MHFNLLKIKTLLLFLSLAFFVPTDAKQNQFAIVTITTKFEIPGNKLSLTVAPTFIGGQMDHDNLFKETSSSNNRIFSFTIPIKEISYFAIQIPGDSLTEPVSIGNYGYLEPGDDIFISIDKGDISNAPELKYYFTYKGKGSKKMDCVESARKAAAFSGHGNFMDSLYRPVKDFITNFKRDVMLFILNQNKDLLSNQSYELLKTDFAYEHERIRWDYLRRLWVKSKEPWQRKKLRQYLDSITAIPLASNTKARLQSKHFPVAYIHQLVTANLIQKSKFDYNNVYEDIKKYKGPERERLVLELFVTNGTILPARDSLLMDAMTWVSNPEYLERLQAISLTIDGKKAPDYGLKNINGGVNYFADYKGKVLVVDFWFTGCSPCAMFYKNVLEPIHHRYENNPDVVFISISVDKGMERWKTGINSKLYTVRSAVNLYTNGEGVAHPVIKTYNVIGYPSPVLIDKDGRIGEMRRSRLLTTENLSKSIDKLLADRKK